MRFPAHQPETSLPFLLLDRLRAARPEVEWAVETAFVYPTPNMAERARALVERYRPAAAFFLCSAVYAEETVVFSIRKRWPRLYGPATRFAALFDGPAGEPGGPGRGLKSLLYSTARRAAIAVAGVAPMVTLDEAVHATTAALRAIATYDEMPVICRSTSGGIRDSSQTPEVRRRVAEYNRKIAAECENLGIAFIETVSEMAAAGLTYSYEPDLVHGDLQARSFTADRAAALLLERIPLGEKTQSQT